MITGISQYTLKNRNSKSMPPVLKMFIESSSHDGKKLSLSERSSDEGSLCLLEHFSLFPENTINSYVVTEDGKVFCHTGDVKGYTIQQLYMMPSDSNLFQKINKKEHPFFKVFEGYDIVESTRSEMKTLFRNNAFDFFSIDTKAKDQSHKKSNPHSKIYGAKHEFKKKQILELSQVENHVKIGQKTIKQSMTNWKNSLFSKIHSLPQKKSEPIDTHTLARP